MDFKVLKLDSIKIDDNYNVYYLNSKNERKSLEIITPEVFLPFGIDRDTKGGLYLNLQLRKSICDKNNHELRLLLKFLENIEAKFKDHTKKDIKTLIRKNKNHEAIINTKVINKYGKITTEVFKNNENYNFYNIDKNISLKTNIIIDKLWIFNDIIFYKIKLKKIFL